MLDFDLAFLYSVEVKQLKRQVRRNIDRFPSDFMFELTKEEYKTLRCQFGTSSLRFQFETSKGGSHRYLPHALGKRGTVPFSKLIEVT